MARMTASKISSARARAALPVNARPEWHELIPGMLASAIAKRPKIRQPELGLPDDIAVIENINKNPWGPPMIR